MNTWRDLLGDRMLIVAAQLDPDEVVEWLGGPPSTRSSEKGRYALVCDPLARGIVSEFTLHGQLVRANITAEDVRESMRLREEWRTIAERLCYRHRLERILCLATELVDASLEVTDRLGVRLLVAPGVVAPA